MGKRLFIIRQNEGFNASTYFGINPPSGAMPITEEQLAKLKNYELCWNKGILIPYEGEKPKDWKEDPKFEELSIKSRIIKLIRERYDANDELAILRQRDTKPEEFREYFDFVEDCKEQVKNEEESNK